MPFGVRFDPPGPACVFSDFQSWSAKASWSIHTRHWPPNAPSIKKKNTLLHNYGGRTRNTKRLEWCWEFVISYGLYEFILVYIICTKPSFSCAGCFLAAGWSGWTTPKPVDSLDAEEPQLATSRHRTKTFCPNRCLWWKATNPKMNKLNIEILSWNSQTKGNAPKCFPIREWESKRVR